MKKITREGLEKLNLDYYSLKADVYGYWKDRKDIPHETRGKAEQKHLDTAYELWVLLESTTCAWTDSFDDYFMRELEELAFQRPTIAQRVKRLLRELLEPYEEMAHA